MDLEYFEFADEWEWQDLNFLNAVPPLVPYPSYCVSRRCGWCRFMIKPGEIITTRSSGGTESTSFVFGDAFNDNKSSATFDRCKSNHASCASIGYHVECSTIASCFGLDKNDFLDVARYSYDPSVQEDERRRDWIVNRLHQLMSREFGILPTEILFMVNQYLVLHYAIASLSHVSRPGRCTIGPLGDVWAKHFNLDGVEYTASLSNSPQLGSRLLWKALDEKEGNVLYISEDHLGIRQIVNDPSEISTEEQYESRWWRTLLITNTTLSFSDDGLKLRSFAAAPLNPTICWQYPMAPTVLKGMTYHATRKSSSSCGMTVEARMIALDFNKPEITGYSTCWYEDNLVDIHVHRSRGSLDFYRELDENTRKLWPAVESKQAGKLTPYWVYHPLDTGEYVEKVWLRTRNETKAKSSSSGDVGRTETAVTMVTSHPRTLIMGKGNSHGEWKCIARALSGSAMKVFFSPSLEGISLFACPTVAGSDQDPLPPELTAETEAEKDTSDYFEASLENVREIVLCQEHYGISGMLFRYNNNKQACVGKFRLDYTQPPLPVAGSACLFIGACTSRDKKSVVKRVSLFDPEDEEGLEWTKIPWKGILEWRFTHEFSHVSSRDS
ncbi:hypothetical protein FGRMN_1508 [Fusarium graminum]|nr:hypothetical protein FGRMN_1508 [Fusarium graminum]